MRVGDIPSAYLQADHVPSNGRPVYIIADRHTTDLIIKAMPEHTDLARRNGTMVLQIKKKPCTGWWNPPGCGTRSWRSTS